MAKFNEYPAKTTPEDADKFMLYSAEDAANKLIDYDKLADAVLNKLTSKTFALDQGNMTLLAALNQLNSNSFRVIISSGSDIIENVIDTQKTDSIMLIYGTTGSGKKQNLPADGCVWLGIAISATDHIFASLYLLGNNHIYARTKADGAWGNYVTIA